MTTELFKRIVQGEKAREASQTMYSHISKWNEYQKEQETLFHVLDKARGGKAV